MSPFTSVGHYAARPAGLPLRQTARKVCIGASVAAFGLYLASPFAALWSISSSIQSHDMKTLGSAINWGLLDASIKQQALSGMHLLQPASDELPEFGSSFASTAVSNAVDVHVSQANLGTLVDEAMPAVNQTTHDTSALSSLISHASFRFARLDQFEMQVPLPGHQNETPLKVEMRIQNWRWKVTKVEFPTQRTPTLTASASPSNA
ncbi:DUF2939 domain-containing protein [Acetobacter cibinongensis]|uniref:DUF2939 domain-containing protein n=1 Tax=Acetobacter cibinongensis TaxID=146475 RepID=A0A1Z5YTU5_9PROT|nr:DUF2939 domain-containing protein [Acetobacter cibinongensis]OUJ01876.1 hypothetical protein HK14_08060 [Acetobacter cibinongensis]GAN59347.1 hypothetical protein Abci_003_110 [Acetobacter cibinongensis]GBQ13617.1 hypothetical protein AA0482_0659 [Acetobacter cibinongensis NRIC 0482]GEL59095.1 hypothetical protein ACI01nite_16970 [Acetobacter cibinongensis]